MLSVETCFGALGEAAKSMFLSVGWRCAVGQEFLGLSDEGRRCTVVHAEPSVTTEDRTAALGRLEVGVDGKEVVLREVRATALILNGVRDEALLEADVVVAVADVAFPGVVGSVEREGVALRVVVTLDLALEGAAVADMRTGTVSLVRPVVLLAIANEGEVGVRSVGDEVRSAVWIGVDVGLERGIPVERAGSVTSRAWVVRVVVVVRLRLDDGVRLNRRDADFWRDEALGDHRAVERFGLVLGRVLFTLARVERATDRLTANQAWDREAALVVLVGVGEEALVDLADVCRVLEGLRRALRLAQGRQKQADEEGDDRHDDEQFDEGEPACEAALIAVRVSSHE